MSEFSTLLRSNQEIADQLVIADVTVRTHVSHILNKLHLANRVQAALYALREDIVSLENGSAESEVETHKPPYH